MKKFEQMKRLHSTIVSYIDQYNVEDVAISGTTADFDRLFELSWKTLKEYMQKELGMHEAKTGSPREILKLAYQQELIQDEQIWLEMLDYRNDDSHHYRKSDAIIYVSKIQNHYLSVIEKCIILLSDKIPAENIPENEIPVELLEYCKENRIAIDAMIEKLKEQFSCSENDIYTRWDEIKGDIKKR